MLQTKIRQSVEDIKQFCREQFWLICVLALLLSIALLGANRWSASHAGRTLHGSDESYVSLKVQISPQELLRIVSLSLTELLNMEVYIQAGSELLRKDPVMMTMLSGEQQLSAHIQEIILSNRARRNRANMLVFTHNCNTNNNEAIVGLT